MYSKKTIFSGIFSYLIIMLVFLLNACSATPPKTLVQNKSIHNTGNAGSIVNTGWRTVRFQIAWQPDIEPNWYIDTMIAGEVIIPVLSTESGKQLKLWRLHRRAKNDVTGHAFSFIFYAQTANAEQIYAAIRSNPLVTQWQREGKLTRIHFDDLQRNNQPNIEDTSDKAWPLPIQKTWPSYIMGAGKMWLDLIAELKATQQNNPPLDLRYREIQQQITRFWETNGQHAWLHHLNALYGYSPIAIHF